MAAVAVARELDLKMGQTVVAAAVQTVHQERLAVLVAKASMAAMLEMETINTEAQEAEETLPQEQTAVARLQTVALAVRTFPQTTPAAAVVPLLVVLPELEEPAAAVLAATVQRLPAALERTTWAAAAVVAEIAVLQPALAARAVTEL